MMVPGDDVLESFFVQDEKRLAQAVKQRQRRRVGKVPGRVRFDLVAEIEIGLAAGSTRHLSARLLTDADNAKAGREHQALLRAGDGEIDAPIVKTKIDAADLSHPVCKK